MIPFVGRALALATIVLLAGCARQRAEVIDVYTASSLGDAMEELAELFESRHPGVDLRVTPAGTQRLRSQIEQGADAEVLISAGASHVDALFAGGLATARSPITCNELVIIAPADSTLVADVPDLPRVEHLVVGAPDVPLGAYTLRFLDRATELLGRRWRAEVERVIHSQELSASAVTAKVLLGEADAAVVYRTDALRAGDAVRVISIPEAMNLRTRYEVVRIGPSSPIVDAWLADLHGARAAAVLARHGFAECEIPGLVPADGSGSPR